MYEFQHNILERNFSNGHEPFWFYGMDWFQIAAINGLWLVKHCVSFERNNGSPAGGRGCVTDQDARGGLVIQLAVRYVNFAFVLVAAGLRRIAHEVPRFGKHYSVIEIGMLA